MSQFTYQSVPTTSQTNGLGVAGFVCSLVGLLFTGGLLSPIGLILSLVALGREPRGFAIAGLVLGLLGTCGWALAWLVAGVAIIGVVLALIGGFVLAAVAEPEKAEVTADMALIAMAIEAERDHTGLVPLSLADLDLEGNVLSDPWGSPYRLVVEADGGAYDILSDGADQTPGTLDDISFKNLDKLWDSPGAVQITTEREGDGQVRIKIGSRTLTVTDGEDGGNVQLDTGEKVIEIRGGEGGSVKVHDSSTSSSDNAPPAPESGQQEAPTGAPPPQPPTPPATPPGPGPD